jgi:hypothetical protein
MYLHQAIKEILQKEKRPMSSREIANAINETGRVQRKDGSLYTANHIITNVNSHLDMFYTDSLYSPLRISLVED